jgi:hypothetical protein
MEAIISNIEYIPIEDLRVLCTDLYEDTLEQLELNKTLQDCLNGSTKATYTAAMYDAERKRANDAELELATIMSTLEPYFTSGNSIEVERAMIPKKVFDLFSVITEANAEILLCAKDQHKNGEELMSGDTPTMSVGLSYYERAKATSDAVRFKEELCLKKLTKILST